MRACFWACEPARAFPVFNLKAGGAVSPGENAEMPFPEKGTVTAV